MMIWSRGKHSLWLWVLISLLISTTTAIGAPDGYLSIDCGATVNSTDFETGISWVTDEPYISTGTNDEVKSEISSPVNNAQLQTLRYFPTDRSKNCYILPASTNSSYLLRPMFVHGRFQDRKDNSFDLSIDSTLMDTIIWTASDIDGVWFYEYMVAATSDQISFCLIPKVGNPFISTLELRKLDVGMYDVVFKGKYLKMINRLNFGILPTDPIVRYPADDYDRFWLRPAKDSTIDTTKTTEDVEIPDSVFDKPPMAVMQSAWVSPLQLQWFTSISKYELGKAKTFYINEFFAEIQNVRSTDTRIIDVSLNDELLINVTVPAHAFQLIGEDMYVDGVGANFTLTANPLSTLGPLLNAAEIYASRDTVSSSTDETDVNALEEVKLGLGLSSWTGDPCLPVSYNWLTCDSGATPRVTKITLSKFDLVGTIPAAIADLTALTDLWLDNNKIYGGIPDLSTLTKLRTLHLQNNKLSGGIPSTLASLPILTELFLSDNKLSGPIPAALANRRGLELRTSGNDKLCAPTENCPILAVEVPDDDGGSDGRGSESGDGSSAALIGGIVGGVVAALAIISVAVWCYCRRPSNPPNPQPTPLPFIDPKPAPSMPSDPEPVSVAKKARSFTLAEVQEATDGYRTKIGEGGFGLVYYGKLSDGTELAVKTNSGTSGQGSTEFANEVSLLSRVHHRNLVSLLGYCEESGQQILIYEYVSNGALREHLYGRDMKGTLNWKARLDIALNAARGLDYLHNACEPKIIHRDIKSNNILLDKRFVAKVADFGISKLAPDEDQNGGVSTAVRGTTGYLDPEYYHQNKLTQKSDVYSFGVVLLEILCGRPPISPNQADAKRYHLVEWARGRLSGNDLESIVDPEIRGTYNVEAMWVVAELAMGCVEPHGVNRPDMKHVMRDLGVALEMEEAKARVIKVASTGGYGTSMSDYPSSFSTESSYPTTQSSVASIPDFPMGSGSSRPNPSAPPLLFTPSRTFTRLPSDPRNSDSSWLSPKPR